MIIAEFTFIRRSCSILSLFLVLTGTLEQLSNAMERPEGDRPRSAKRIKYSPPEARLKENMKRLNEIIERCHTRPITIKMIQASETIRPLDLQSTLQQGFTEISLLNSKHYIPTLCIYGRTLDPGSEVPPIVGFLAVESTEEEYFGKEEKRIEIVAGYTAQEFRNFGYSSLLRIANILYGMRVQANYISTMAINIGSMMVSAQLGFESIIEALSNFGDYDFRIGTPFEGIEDYEFYSKKNPEDLRFIHIAFKSVLADQVKLDEASVIPLTDYHARMESFIKKCEYLYEEKFRTLSTLDSLKLSAFPPAPSDQLTAESWCNLAIEPDLGRIFNAPFETSEPERFNFMFDVQDKKSIMTAKRRLESLLKINRKKMHDETPVLGCSDSDIHQAVDQVFFD